MIVSCIFLSYIYNYIIYKIGMSNETFVGINGLALSIVMMF